jgi:hypothetical protein
VSQKRLKFFYLGGSMSEDHELQKQLVIARMAQILGNKGRAEAWLATPREDFDWRTASGAIDDGEYELVWDCIVRIETGVY